MFNKRTSVMCPTARCHFLGRTSPTVGCWTRGRKTAHSDSQWKSFTHESTTFNLHLLCCSRWPGLWTHHVIRVCSVITVQLCLPELMTCVRFSCDRCCSKYTGHQESATAVSLIISLLLHSPEDVFHFLLCSPFFSSPVPSDSCSYEEANPFFFYLG